LAFEEEGYLRYSNKKRGWVLWAAIAVIILLVVVGLYWVLQEEKTTVPEVSKEPQKELPRMANLPPKQTTLPTPPPPSYTPDAPVLEQARKALAGGLSPQEAVDLANSLPESPERADAAFLLLEYAADEGHAGAMLAVGRYYDPTHKGPSGTIQKNPETAYVWYKEALKGGQGKAEAQLAQLRRWVDLRAQEGSSEARAVLEVWD
jgi:TPR repeat protein